MNIEEENKEQKTVELWMEAEKIDLLRAFKELT